MPLTFRGLNTWMNSSATGRDEKKDLLRRTSISSINYINISVYLSRESSACTSLLPTFASPGGCAPYSTRHSFYRVIPECLREGLTAVMVLSTATLQDLKNIGYLFQFFFFLLKLKQLLLVSCQMAAPDVPQRAAEGGACLLLPVL